MRKCLTVVLLVALAADARAVTIAWSPVGNPGNPADTTVMFTDGTSGYGAVGYAYNIGTYDVTASQYVEFLNAKDATGLNTLGLYNSSMSDATFGGINFNVGNANGNKYSIISGRGDHPANSTTWYDAIRFANWLNNGQGNADTETGAYTLLGGTPTPSNGNSITRNAGAAVFLPSENEWYKAAFYNPANSSYFQYPTSSDAIPIASAPTAIPNSANYGSAVGNVTDVGAYTATTSPYGAFDMGGNVFQWNEALINDSERGARGGSWLQSDAILLSSARNHGSPPGEFTDFGFRVASLVPEPNSFVLAALSLAGLVAMRWRRRSLAR
jgi:sulfatase modifying factor 1